MTAKGVSVNFAFLAVHDQLLVRLAAQAEGCRCNAPTFWTFVYFLANDMKGR